MDRYEVARRASALPARFADRVPLDPGGVGAGLGAGRGPPRYRVGVAP